MLATIETAVKMEINQDLYNEEETVKQGLLEKVTKLLHVEPKKFNKNDYKKKAYTKTYSRLSLSRLRLSRITAFLEEKIWSLF